MQVLPLGIGDAFSARFYSSCLALEHDDRWILIDCPHPLRKMLREASSQLPKSLDIADIEAICLTHLHADHCSGLESFAYFSFFALGRKVRLFCHPDVRKRLWDASLAAGMERLILHGRSKKLSFEDYFDYSPLSLDQPVSVGPFQVEARRTIHHIPTTALRLTAGQRCLGYSADTSFDPRLIDWLSKADLIIHETNLGAHTPYESLLTLPEDIRARMRLIHATDEFDRENSLIPCLAQGQLISLSDRCR